MYSRTSAAQTNDCSFNSGMNSWPPHVLTLFLVAYSLKALHCFLFLCLVYLASSFVNRSRPTTNPKKGRASLIFIRPTLIPNHCDFYFVVQISCAVCLNGVCVWRSTRSLFWWSLLRWYPWEMYRIDRGHSRSRLAVKCYYKKRIFSCTSRHFKKSRHVCNEACADGNSVGVCKRNTAVEASVDWW